MKSGNSESLKKVIILVRKLPSLCAHSWRGFAEGVLEVALSTILCFKWSVRKEWASKIFLVKG